MKLVLLLLLLLMLALHFTGYGCSIYSGPDPIYSQAQLPYWCVAQQPGGRYITPMFQPNSTRDRDVLRNAKSSWGNILDLQTWNQFELPCGSPGWRHVICDSEGRVTGLNLSGPGLTQYLVGPLPADLLELSVVGTLQFLDLSQNNLTGSLPGITAGSKLQSLKLDSNSFVGTLPSSWRFMTQLKEMDLSHNTLQVSGGLQHTPAKKRFALD